MIQSTVLDSGVRVILDVVDNTEVVSLGLWQLGGSRDERISQTGFSHFLEHMLFKGTSKRSAYEIAQTIERVGGYLNAFTEKEVTCFYCTLPAEAVEVALDVLADMYFNACLDDSEIEKEKTVIFNEIQTIEDNPEEKGHQIYLEKLWNGHRLSRKITGEVSDVQSIDKQRLSAFYRGRFTPKRTVVTAGGKLDSERVMRALERHFAAGSPADDREQRIAPVAHQRWDTFPDKFEQVHLFTGTSFSALQDLGEYYQDLVFNTLFGESMSSRLFQRLRENRGLCYSVSSFRTYFTDVAMWTIYANTAPSLFKPLLEAVNEQLARLHSEPPTEGEIENAQCQLRGHMILAKEDMENRMKRLFRQYHLTNKVIEYDTSMSLLAEVRRQDVLSIIEQRIRPDGFNLLAYGSSKLGRLERNGYTF